MNSNSVVIDTNLVFSALIPKVSQIRDILFENNMNKKLKDGLRQKGFHEFYDQQVK